MFICDIFPFGSRLHHFYLEIVNETDWMVTIETIDERAKSVDALVFGVGIIIIS